MSEEPLRPTGPPPPTSELLLAHALDACIEAEHQAPGGSESIIAAQPDWAQAELRQLLDLTRALDAAATEAVVSDDFRAGARARLMQRIGGDATLLTAPGPRLVSMPSTNGYHRTGPSRRARRWLWRGSAGLLAAVLGVAATLTASASALPGEPLYGLKQAQEELGVRLASDDQTRALALLRRADARLDEATRLLEQGRASDAANAAQQYDATVQRATTTYVVTMDESPSPDRVADRLDAALGQQQQQLQQLLQSAPESARGDLREALVATQRSRALVADPQPVERALGRPTREPAVAAMAAAPTPEVEVEQVPTLVPTAVPAPTATPVIALTVPRGEALANQVQRRNDDEGRGGRGDDGERPVVVTGAPAVSVSSSGRDRGGSQVRQPQQQQVESHDEDRGGGDDAEVQAPAAPPLQARGGDGDSHDQSTVARSQVPASTVARTTEQTNSGANGNGNGNGNSNRDNGSGNQTVVRQQSGGGAASAQGDRNDARPAPTLVPTQVAKPQPTQVRRSGNGNGGGGGGDGDHRGGGDGH